MGHLADHRASSGSGRRPGSSRAVHLREQLTAGNGCRGMAAVTSYWTLVPCMPRLDTQTPPRYYAGCRMLEGYRDDEHSHWLNPEGVEVVTRHRPGEPKRPNCYIRSTP